MSQSKVTANLIPDSEGRYPEFFEGDIVYVIPLKVRAIVVQQILHYDGPETFWGNVEVEYTDGSRGMCHCWQLRKDTLDNG